MRIQFILRATGQRSLNVGYEPLLGPGHLIIYFHHFLAHSMAHFVRYTEADTTLFIPFLFPELEYNTLRNSDKASSQIYMQRVARTKRYNDILAGFIAFNKYATSHSRERNC